MLKIILSPLIAYFIAHLIKLLSALKESRKFNIKQMVKAGGMPSAHSATVTALTLSVYLYNGLNTLFAVTIIFSLIVIRDTMIRTKDTRHKPIEVLAGIMLGLLVAFLISII
ncbi:MAG: divergent PAP2 family protein [Nanoarchaeota archaeon]|nr:divergent PAP2 family protein [Nanoarchaeota archaeon]